MESTASTANPVSARLAIRLLGPAAIFRDGAPIPLPPSRKVRALFGYLAVAPHPVPRERLCTLLWSVPNDPRGELRWCLSKLRALLDEADHPRVIRAGDRLRLDLAGCDVDVLRLLSLAGSNLDGFDLAALQEAAAACRGEFLEGGEIDGLEFEQWLAGRRSELRSAHVRIAAAIARRLPVGSPEALASAREWLELAPLDAEAHEHFLVELLRRRMHEDCTRHLAAAEKLFADEAVDFMPIRATWDRLRSIPAAPLPSSAHPPMQPRRPEQEPARLRRASVAVMPFRELTSGTTARSELGDAIAHDVITRLARLRSLSVIARGSVFALADEPLDVTDIGRRLGVGYVATGFLERREESVVVAVEVADAETARILWTERFEAGTRDRLSILDGIGDGIVSSIAAEIENAEKNRAVLKHPDSLDAWEAYHRGLWHMYRFTPEENAVAARFFRRSSELDPTFSRAHAGLSFTHWQNAFQRWGDRAAETRQALEAAGRSLLVDDQNPAAHWSMGRALWLSGDHDQSASALARSVDLSPNFALGHYAVSFVHAQIGDPDIAISASEQSRLLSPYDPLLFGILATRAIALVRLGRYEEAADWALRAAARPNAHVHILGIAAHCLVLAGRLDEARLYAGRARRSNPAYGVDAFLDTFHFTPDTIALYRSAAARIGFG